MHIPCMEIKACNWVDNCIKYNKLLRYYYYEWDVVIKTIGWLTGYDIKPTIQIKVMVVIKHLGCMGSTS